MKKLVRDFEDIHVEEFDISYDLTTLFKVFSYLNISEIAERIGINSGLMRQYASGTKFPSRARVVEIMNAIKEIGKELAKVKLHPKDLAEA